MSITAIWFALMGALIVVEFLSGTVYLLMLALGALAAALVAYFGGNLSAQMLVAAIVGGGATLAWHCLRPKSAKGLSPKINQDVQQDIGARIEVKDWADNGQARVQYRGSTWTVRAKEGTPIQQGLYEVVAVEGAHLVVTLAQ